MTELNKVTDFEKIMADNNIDIDATITNGSIRHNMGKKAEEYATTVGKSTDTVLMNLQNKILTTEYPNVPLKDIEVLDMFGYMCEDRFKDYLQPKTDILVKFTVRIYGEEYTNTHKISMKISAKKRTRMSQYPISKLLEAVGETDEKFVEYITKFVEVQRQNLMEEEEIEYLTNYFTDNPELRFAMQRYYMTTYADLGYLDRTEDGYPTHFLKLVIAGNDHKTVAPLRPTGEIVYFTIEDFLLYNDSLKSKGTFNSGMHLYYPSGDSKSKHLKKGKGTKPTYLQADM